MGLLTRTRLLFALVAGSLLGAGIAAGVLLTGSGSAPAPQARQYLDVSACLLTGPRGVTPGSPAAPVWASMEAASLRSHVMVSYLPDIAPQKPQVLLDSLVQRRCGVIITTGAPPGLVVAAARANPGQRFVVVADAPGTAAPANAVVVPSADATSRIGSVVRALATHEG